MNDRELLELAAKTLCWIGLHLHEWIPVPYHYRCSRCGKETYVGH